MIDPNDYPTSVRADLPGTVTPARYAVGTLGAQVAPVGLIARIRDLEIALAGAAAQLDVIANGGLLSAYAARRAAETLRNAIAGKPAS